MAARKNPDVKRKGGRKTYLTPDTPAQVLEYASEGYKTREAVPTRAGLACHLGVSRRTVEQWSIEKLEDGSYRYPEFREAYEFLLAQQEMAVLSGGLTEVYNSTICKLILSHNHGYAEKTEQKVEGEIGVRRLERRIVRPGD